ncbi:Hint domain-containing protein [Gymnodinialimonas sp. 2305UL16-5]|uniref:Hint domain-containing protein n=1 Tax=Gymnodinialimonas mytili TaxID=3126503 RepID=UPI0030A99D74
MPTTFNVIFLGNNPDLDTTEGNNLAENASALVGQTFGGFGNALSGNIRQLTPVGGGRRFDTDGNTYYDQDDATPERYRVDGVREDFDSSVVYDATITYLDGSTATITAVVFQATNGNTYLAPEFAANADQTALEAGPILSLTLDSLSGDTFLGMTADREAFNAVPCFVAGTRIATSIGPKPVEDLAIGDLLMTLDRGAQPIRWIGCAERHGQGVLAPIRISKGALGEGMPERDLYVSGQHRMMVRSRVADRMFGSAEVLIPAKKLLGLPGISVAETPDQVRYYHLLLDQHEIIQAEGAPAETLLVGPQGLAAMDRDARAELELLFPELVAADLTPARIIPKGNRQKRLIARHSQNAQPVLQY